MFEQYGSPNHGKPVVTTLDDAIRYLAAVHTRRSFDGEIELVANARPRDTEHDQRLYRESCAILRRSLTDETKAPLGGIDSGCLDQAEDRVAMAATVTLDRYQFRALLAIARNRLRPKAV